MSMPYKAPWSDRWETPWMTWRNQQQLQTDPANTIANGLAGGQRNDPTLPPAAAQDTASGWGEWTGTNRMYINQQAPDQTGAASSAIASGLGGLNLPGGWNAAGNKFQYNIPLDFRANENLYQHGYDPNADAGGIDVGRGRETENNFNRVYGWLNAVAKANNYNDISQMPPDKQAQAMAYAVGRLRTDSFNVDKSGAAWQRSGFAGYDKYLAQPGQTATLGNPQQPNPAPAGTFTPAQNEAIRRDPSLAARYDNGTPPATGAEARTQTGIADGAQSAANGLAGAAQVANPLNTPTKDPEQGKGVQGNGTMPAGRYGAGSAAILAQDPAQAYRAMIESQGKKYNPRGLFSKFNESMFGNALSAYIMSQTQGGTQGLDNFNSILGNFASALNGGNFYGTMRSAADGAASGIDLDKLDPDKADQLIKQLLGLKTMGYNKFAQNGAQNGYEDTVNDYTADILKNHNGEDTGNYGSTITSSPWWQSLFAATGAR